MSRRCAVPDLALAQHEGRSTQVSTLPRRTNGSLQCTQALAHRGYRADLPLLWADAWACPSGSALGMIYEMAEALT
jgi:hypothetical protein